MGLDCTWESIGKHRGSPVQSGFIDGSRVRRFGFHQEAAELVRNTVGRYCPVTQSMRLVADTQIGGVVTVDFAVRSGALSSDSGTDLACGGLNSPRMWVLGLYSGAAGGGGFNVPLDNFGWAVSPSPRGLSAPAGASDSRRGTDEFHTPRDVAAAFVDSFLEAGFTVEVDHPFSGALVPLSRMTSIGLGQFPASV
jgi:hypothetical protein